MSSKNLVKIGGLTKEQIASICDHTYLNRPEAYKAIAKPGESPMKLREEAFEAFLDKTLESESKPYAVCVRPEDVRKTRSYLSGTGIKIASVVGFPDGTVYQQGFKTAEANLAIQEGATEIDTVLNYRAMKNGDIAYALNDAGLVRNLAHKRGALVKLILETSELTPLEIVQACNIATACEVDFVKTSTGFSAYGATSEALMIMRQKFQGGIKISGGVTPNNVNAFLLASSGRTDGKIDLDPLKIRIGESSLLDRL